MTEAQDTYAAWQSTDCDKCEAVAGEPCRDDCPGSEVTAEDVHLLAAEAARKDREVPGVTQLYRALHQLPYAGTQKDVPLPVSGQDFDDWTAELAEWIRCYAAWDRKEMIEAEGHRRRRISLDMQVGVVRSFFHEEILKGGQYGYAK